MTTRYANRPEHDAARRALLDLIPRAPEQWLETFLAELEAEGLVALVTGRGWQRS